MATYVHSNIVLAPALKQSYTRDIDRVVKSGVELLLPFHSAILYTLNVT